MNDSVCYGHPKIDMSAVSRPKDRMVDTPAFSVENNVITKSPAYNAFIDKLYKNHYEHIKIINSFLTTIFEQLYLISRGVRDCLWASMTWEEYQALKPHLISEQKEYGIHWIVNDDTNDESHGPAYSIFIYKYEHQKEMFEAAAVHGSLKGTEIGHYILGKLFGYSEKSCDEFFKKLKEDGNLRLGAEISPAKIVEEQ